MILPSGAILQGGRYQIERELGHGGFGFTYLATQKGLNRKVAIKEFFMRDYCERDANTSQVSLGTSGSREMIERFRRKFIKEAQNIAMLNHANIIRIYDVFEEHGTAYYVMEYLDRGSLRDLVNRRGKLSEQEALFYIKQIASALAYIHERRMNHLDVKPNNVLIDESNNAVLIDFGLAKQYDQEGQQTSTTPVGISHGYAPLEQYQRGGVSVFSPASDIYSLGATLYFLLMGETPPDANMVNDEGLPPLPESLSSNVVEAIEKAVHPRRKFRLQSVADFLKILDTASAPVVVVKKVEQKVVDESTQVDTEIFVDDKVSQDEIEKATAFQTFVDLFYRCKKYMVTVCTALVVIIAACIVDWGSLFAPSSPSADPEPLVHNDDSLTSTVVDTLNASKTEVEPVKPQEVKQTASKTEVEPVKPKPVEVKATVTYTVSDIVDEVDETKPLKSLQEVPRTNIAIASQDYVGGTDDGISSDDLKKSAGDKMSPTQSTSGGTSSSSSTKNTEFSVVDNGNAKVYTVKGVTFKMIKVRGGTFQMGATPEQTGADDDEKPVHSVTLSDYYIGETEVTQELWAAVMGNNPSNFKGNALRPVESVTWNDCQTFISKLNALTGENFRLPTEAQWEFAARGGNKSRGHLYSGSNSIGDVAWYEGTSGYGYKTHAVKTKSSNELGIYDMSGNVREWCQDWYAGYSSAAVTNPTGPASRTYRVSRGGCWNSDASNCRAANRYIYAPSASFSTLGFRLAR